MAHRAMWVVVALLAPFSVGCGTLAAHCGKDPYSPYGGVSADVGAIQSGIESVIGVSGKDSDDWKLAFLMLAVFDLPFSALADTFLLPDALSNRR